MREGILGLVLAGVLVAFLLFSSGVYKGTHINHE